MAVYNLGEVLRWQGRSEGRSQKVRAGRRPVEENRRPERPRLRPLQPGRCSDGGGIRRRSRLLQPIDGAADPDGKKGNPVESQMALALLMFEEGDAIGAESSLREAREEFRKEGIGDDKILANTLLARILLAQGRLADAQTEFSEVHDLLAKSQDLSVHLRASLAEAQLAAADGHPQEAIRILQTTIASARKLGYLGYQLESELALAEVEITSGRGAAGLSLLEAVRREAQQKGFQLIAYKATRVSGKSAAN